jgi:hypothetical protein
MHHGSCRDNPNMTGYGIGLQPAARKVLLRGS